MRSVVVAWLLSLVALGLSLAGIDPLGGGPSARSDLVLVLWLAVGALPRRGVPGATRGSVLRELAVPLGLLLAPLGLAAGLDARHAPLEWFARQGSHLALALVLSCLLLAVARARQPVARRVAAFGWLALVPGWAALELSTGFAASTSGGASPAARALSPLGWCVTGEGLVDGLSALVALGLLGSVVFGCERWEEGTA